MAEPPYQFFCTKRYGNNLTGTLRVPQMQFGYEKSRFLTNILLYIGNDARQGHSYYGTLIGNRICDLSNFAVFNDLE